MRGISFAQKSEKIVNKILSCASPNPIVFLDSGAVIDFEKLIRRYRPYDRDASFDTLYGSFLSQGATIYTTGEVHEELENHQNVFINRFPEVSLEAMHVLGGSYKRFVDFFERNRSAINFDDIRYHTYWASQLAFPTNHKKLNKDAISLCDRDLISAAFGTKAIIDYYKNGARTTGASVIIVSPDSHVLNTTRVLTDSHAGVSGYYPQINWRFGYNGVRTVSSS